MWYFLYVFLLIIPLSCWICIYLCVNIFHIYLCVLLLPPFDLPRSHSPPTNPTISAAAAASLIMSALTSWRYQQQQQFLFQSLRYTCTKGNSSRAHHRPKRSTKRKKIGIICTTLHDAFISGSLSNFVHKKYHTRQPVCFSKIAILFGTTAEQLEKKKCISPFFSLQ